MKNTDNIVIWDVYDEMSFESDDVIDKSLGRFNGVFVKHYSGSDYRSFQTYVPSSMNEEVNNNDHEENMNISKMFIQGCVGIHMKMRWGSIRFMFRKTYTMI